MQKISKSRISQTFALFLTLIIAISCLTLLVVKPANAQIATPAPSLPSSTDATLMWNRTYTNSNLNSVASAIKTANGGFILAGITSSNGIPTGLELMKIDSSGNPLWSKIYPNTAGGMSNYAKWIVQTSDGGYGIAGRFEGNAWLAKLDAEGNMQWNKTYIVGTANGGADFLIKTSDGGFALTGVSLMNNESSVFSWLIRTDSFGNQQLNTILNGATAGIDSIIQTSDGGYAFTTESSRIIIERGEIKIDCMLTKIDSNGSPQWSQVYPDFGDGWSIVQTNDGGYVLGGGGIALLKTDSFGVMQWNQSYGSGQAWVMTQTSDSGFALAGTALVKTDASGNEQWALNFPAGAHAYIVVQTNEGGYLCAGQLLLGSATARTSWVAKINPIPTQSIMPTPAVSTSPSVPEFSWLAILPLFVSALFVAIILRHRKTTKLNQ
jgi:hypothetical protein